MFYKEGSFEVLIWYLFDWQFEVFYDQVVIDVEMMCVFDICVGCWCCVLLCGVFLVLFDLVDDMLMGDIEEVLKVVFGKVVDQCYLCDFCYMMKCLYVLLYVWNVDFLYLMLCGKVVCYKCGEVMLCDKVLLNIDVFGYFVGILVVMQVVNVVNCMLFVCYVFEVVFGVDCYVWLLEFVLCKFWCVVRCLDNLFVCDGECMFGKVVIYVICYVNFNELGIGYDLFVIFVYNEILYEFVVCEVCCGMLLFE